jgi:hypothetical protein
MLRIAVLQSQRSLGSTSILLACKRILPRCHVNRFLRGTRLVVVGSQCSGGAVLHIIQLPLLFLDEFSLDLVLLN